MYIIQLSLGARVLISARALTFWQVVDDEEEADEKIFNFLLIQFIVASHIVNVTSANTMSKIKQHILA